MTSVDEHVYELASHSIVRGLTLGYFGSFGGIWKSCSSYTLWTKLDGTSTAGPHFTPYGVVECGILWGPRYDWTLYTPLGIVQAVGHAKKLEITFENVLIGRLICRQGWRYGRRFVCSVEMPKDEVVCTIKVPFLKEVCGASTSLEISKAGVMISKCLSIWTSTSSVDPDTVCNYGELTWCPPDYKHKTFATVASSALMSFVDKPRLTCIHPPSQESRPLFSNPEELSELSESARLATVVSALIASGL